MIREDFQAVADLVFKVTSELVGDGKDVHHMMLMITLDADHKIDTCVPIHVGELFRDDAGKNIMGQVLKEAVHKVPGAIIALVSEAWMVFNASKKDEAAIRAGKIRASQHPDRKEAVICNMSTADLSVVAIYRIERNPNKLLYAPIDWDQGQLSGRLIPQRSVQ